VVIVAGLSTVCLDCRTAFLGGGRCDGPDHTTVNLARERQDLIEAVWGDFRHQIEAVRGVYAARARSFQSTAVGMGLGIVAGLILGIGPLPVLATMTGGAITLSALGRRRARKQPPVHPRGAQPVPALMPFARGRIRAAAGLASPASGLACAAWALEFRYEAAFGSRIMLRVGQTAGMEIALDNDERVRIPAGPIRMVQRLPQLADHDVAELEAWLREIDPARALAGELCTAIPFNVIGEDALQVGDRIELYEAFVPAVLAGGSAALYREAPATILVPRTIATLRRLT
jgi:hypothetical protein